MKGQGATEYLVLLAAVLIIALVSLALLGFFPGMAGDAKISQSNSYWRSESKPFGIVEHAMVMPVGTGSRDGNLTMVFQLKDASGKFVIRNITLDEGAGTAYTIQNLGTGKSFNAGEIKTIMANVTNELEVGDVYEILLNISYSSPNGITATQYGVKPLIGKVTGA